MGRDDYFEVYSYLLFPVLQGLPARHWPRDSFEAFVRKYFKCALFENIFKCALF